MNLINAYIFVNGCHFLWYLAKNIYFFIKQCKILKVPN